MRLIDLLLPPIGLLCSLGMAVGGCLARALFAVPGPSFL